MCKFPFSPRVLLLCGVLLAAGCSHPLPKLAYPDGSIRSPINPTKPAAAPSSASGVRS
ncbi:MAG: hypothetical protein ACM32J_06025 [Rhizobacter sp.]